MDNRPTEQSQGKVLGGSSSINASIFIPSSRAGIEAWAKLGNPSWTYDALLPYYKKAYALQPPDANTCHKTGIGHLTNPESSPTPGPIRVSFPSLHHEIPISKAWNDILRGIGCEPTADLFPDVFASNRYFPAAIDSRTGKRSSADIQYAESASKRSNLTFVTDATVYKVILDNDSPEKLTAKGVEAYLSGMTLSIIANKEVILCAGVFNTPKILELSGIGNAELLKSVKIPLAVSNSSVGENLQNHIMIIFRYELHEGLETGNGIQSLAFTTLQDRADQKDLFTKLLPDETHQKDFHDVVRGILDTPNEASGLILFKFAAQSHSPVFILFQTLPLSRGNSHISSADPRLQPRINPRSFSHPLDVEILARHLQTLIKLTSFSPMKDFFKQGGPDISTLESAKAHLRKNAEPAFHACGTAAMLPRERGGVVDENLVVYGTANLRVVDASIFPLITTANPMATVYAVAERAADIIKSRGGK